MKTELRFYDLHLKFKIEKGFSFFVHGDLWLPRGNALKFP